MRSLSLTIPSLLFASLALLNVPALASPFVSNVQLLRRDGNHGHHNPHAQPIVQLNETEVLMYHQPTPPSYYTIDWEGEGDQSQTRHPGLMVGHIVFMSMAFFGALPIGIVLRSVRHPAHGAAMISFYVLSALGLSSSMLYRKLTPNMLSLLNIWTGAAHGKQGYLFLLLAVALSTVDILRVIKRVIAFARSQDRSIKSFWTFVIINQEPETKLGSEYASLVVEEPSDGESPKVPSRHSEDLQTLDGTERWANDVHRHHRLPSAVSEQTIFGQTSSLSDDTLHDNQGAKPTVKEKRSSRIWNIAFIVLERSLVVAGLAQVLSGIVIYTGGCRQHYINGCLAHLIKGAIFWCYGLLTFARFLGSFAQYGWAWNRSLSSSSCTAEFVESLVIFIYGITNTWMERFGAKSGDPFSTKQIQHISIAVMFWFAGLLGMGIESRRIRRWLASSTFASAPDPAEMPHDAVPEPPSYRGSFNPFPALVIGVTGAAMAAHFQTYLFQVQIHSLWGNLLVAFSVLRCFTYFFLWLSPPQSILPSRPPTEALCSFFLACGGLVFIFSTEEVTIAAMRRGRDDVMMFLNVAVATTCLAFCWTLCIVGLKGYLQSRKHSSVTYCTATSA
ncbi:cytoplasmic protein [Coprinopsis marcescibilis]|uniref:Cytoplasmic protein n=1 Tax=Coprinopsis marcescibilis TaxID=230819 RepID=A0A5C3L9H4_COPMA|nr:cytoplasmic protein [Coprinopsis marcescibilis]